MAFDKTLPANNTKIRQYPTVLTANFAGVEEGVDSLQQWKINLIERNAIPSAPPVDPARIDNTMQLYSKQNADGETDLYVIDDRSTANVVQLTENGRIGGAAQDFTIDEFYFVDNDTKYDAGNIVKARGSFNSSGVLTNGSNMSTSGTPNPSTGVFNVDVDADVLENGSSYQVFCTCVTGISTNARTINIVSKATPATGVATTIQVQVYRRDGNTKINQAFEIMVIGGI